MKVLTGKMMCVYVLVLVFPLFAEPSKNKVITSDVCYFDTRITKTNDNNKVVAACTPNWYFPVTNNITITKGHTVYVNFEKMEMTISNKTEVITIKAELENKERR